MGIKDCGYFGQGKMGTNAGPKRAEEQGQDEISQPL
ncbi:hypothetical protein Pvag_pPag30222 (plasmid) [Pantoea vagans C9-1]|nr:hypothetical protein Pvag_pPag30222 [Pantoea vagans C9-1]